MATVTIKNIPDDLYNELKRSAEVNRRSINSEAIVCLERSLGRRRVDIDEILTRIRGVRRRTAHLALNDTILAKAKRDGRP